MTTEKFFLIFDIGYVIAAVITFWWYIWTARKERDVIKDDMADALFCSMFWPMLIFYVLPTNLLERDKDKVIIKSNSVL